MKHIDLFSGIGGFSYAFDNVFHEQKNEHIFVEIDPFCQEVLKKHWPKSRIISDIRAFADTDIWQGGSRDVSKPRNETYKKPCTDNSTSPHSKSRIKQQLAMERKSNKEKHTSIKDCFLLTGGFPCQPFSQAGRRKGTADDRYLWPAMLSAIAFFKPQWVIAENVAGLASWNNGMVFETVCVDLEAQGYEVQPFIIPALAVEAPHRRDRIWFVAHDPRYEHGSTRRNEAMEKDTTKRTSRFIDLKQCSENASNTERTGCKGKVNKKGQSTRHYRGTQSPDWTADWSQVATRLCGVFNGLSRGLDKSMSDGIYLKHAKTAKKLTRQSVPCLWKLFQSQKVQWRIGRFDTIQDKAYVFTVLWQLSGIAKGQNNLSFESAKVQEAYVRNMWNEKPTGCPPRRWGYKKQYALKHKDALSQLSHEVALVASEIKEAYFKNRNPRLKSLGNAIVPQVAIEIMKAIKNVETIQPPK